MLVGTALVMGASNQLLSPQDQEKIEELMTHAKEQMEDMRHEMEQMEENDHGHFLRGPPPRPMFNFFGHGPPPPRPGDDESFRSNHHFFGQFFGHEFHHGPDGNHGPDGHHGHEGHHGPEGHHHGPGGFFLRLFGKPPPPPLEDREDREDLRENKDHHQNHGHFDGDFIRMMCHKDRQKFCSDTHMPFFTLMCLKKHFHELSDNCAEVLPKHPLRCIFMHLLIMVLSTYFMFRLTRLVLRKVRARRQQQQSQYPGNVVVVAHEVDSTVFMGKVVPVELDMGPVEAGTTAVPTKAVSV